MIVPVTEEERWMDALADVPLWRLPQRHTVVIAPHPDDETLGAGGLIAGLRQNGCEVTIIAVTNGEHCYAGEHLGELRIAEQQRALAVLGVENSKICRLNLPDSSVHEHEEQLHDDLCALVPGDAQLIAPWRHDFHPDHEVCGRVAHRLAGARSLPLHSYFFWTWHRGTPGLLEGLPLVRLPVTEQQCALKREALFCHDSQLNHISGEPILPRNLLEPAWRPFEVYLPA